MTTRKSGNRRSRFQSVFNRVRLSRQRQDRRSLLEALEQRQLLAGPELIGIQPNAGSLLTDGGRITHQPRELVFQFDAAAEIDPESLGAIRVTRAGGDGRFESADTTYDFGTGGNVLVQFNAVPTGVAGNGVRLVFNSSDRPAGSPLPLIQVEDRQITVELNRNPVRATTVGALITALQNDPQASQLVTAVQLAGASINPIGATTLPGSEVELRGANAASAVSDFGTEGAVRVRVLSATSGAEGRGRELIVERRNFFGPASPAVLIQGNNVRVQLNSAPGFETSVAQLIDAINGNPQASQMLFLELQAGHPDTLLGNRPTNYSPLVLAGARDVDVIPGFVGLGSSPREVVFRFAEPLPDDRYQVTIVGEGSQALQSVDGDPFNNGNNFGLEFNLDLGPRVLAVVPEPTRRQPNGSLSPEVGVIEVHFNNDTLDPELAEDPRFYQLYFTRNTVSGNDDVLVLPTGVTYSSVTNIATLQFAQPLARTPDPLNQASFLTGAARLRVGQIAEAAHRANQLVPQEFTLGEVEPGDSFATALDLSQTFDTTGSLPQALTLRSEIFNTTPFGLDMPGGPNVPGVSRIRPEDPSRLDRIVPLDYLRRGPDRLDGITTISYDFPSSFLGDDPNQPGQTNTRTYFNVITEEQKQRVREAIHLFSEHLGIQFVETSGTPVGDFSFSVVVGDLAGAEPSAVSGPGGLAVVTRDRTGDGRPDLGVMDFQDFDSSLDDRFGGPFFRGAMLLVGQMLGFGFADDLPQPVTQSTASIFAPGNANEPAFPSPSDIVNGQYMYRPDSTDIDLYRFQIAQRGSVSIQTIAERLPQTSLLDSTLRLFRQLPGGTWEEIAANDNYFSRDSLIELDLNPGTYVVGVSASGNDEYNPVISGTGFGGRSEGPYQLRMQFTPASPGAALSDSGLNATSAGAPTALDGNADGSPGGLFNFWFVPADPTTTLYVDKAAPTLGSGTTSNPFRNLKDAISAAQPGQTIRVVANGGADGLVHTKEDNLAYQIGVDSLGNELPDGRSLVVPRGVNLVIDAGVIFKMRNSRVGVGSTAPTVDISGSSLQILGTPTLLDATGQPVRDSEGNLVPGSVIFTSYNDDTVGRGNTPQFTPTPRSGDWGGIDFRGDLDARDPARVNLEDEGIFLNHIQFADLRFGGGAVSVDGRTVAVSPIDMAITRPTIVYSRISSSADAAISATPDTFKETRFDAPEFQAAERFIVDYDRAGPMVHGNQVVGNSINGLFIRVVTRAGSTLQPLTVQARWDNIDIPHVLTENLVIQGQPGGAIADSNAPSALLISLQPASGTELTAGSYAYRVTNVDAGGQESAPSAQTLPITLATAGAVRLSQLPTVAPGSGFVGRRLYRATITVDPTTGDVVTGPFQQVAQLNASSTTFIDRNPNPGAPLIEQAIALRSRPDARLKIDPGLVLKMETARIEARFGANLLAEGVEGLPVVFTSLEDQRYGGSGTFDTNGRGDFFDFEAGDWAGIYVGQGAAASLDHAVIAGGGGTARIEGGFASFNAIEVHQANLRLANSRLERNADGRLIDAGERVGRGNNAAGTIFGRFSTPVIVNNQVVDGEGPALSFDINSLNFNNIEDRGRATGRLDAFPAVGNSGPLVRGNRLDNNGTNGMQVRGGELATRGVWDDYDIVHVVRDTIEIPNQFVHGGLLMKSDPRGSLVVKFEDDQEPAGIVVGGNLMTAADQLRAIPDRIGGALQIVGQPDFPVVLTTLADDFAGAGFTPGGLPSLDTNNDGLLGGDLSQSMQPGERPLLPTVPQVNRGTLIDNNVDINTVGYFSADIGNGGQVVSSGVTVLDAETEAVLANRDFIFAHTTYVIVGNTGTTLADTTITQPATLIANDLVESRGTFNGPNGPVNWTVQSYFLSGIATLFTTLDLESVEGELGDIRVISYLDEDVVVDPDPEVAGFETDILYTVGTPGLPDFRAFTIDSLRRVGFSHGGFYSNDGVNQENANFLGWSADLFPLLEAQIANGSVPLSIAGAINTDNLPPAPDPDIGVVYGPGDVTTAFGWGTNPLASTSRITAFLDLIPEEPGDQDRIQAGLWNGITIREAASDRNVVAITENESAQAMAPGTNNIPGQAQFLGQLAPNEFSGDENRRLGFVISGRLAAPHDIDVYSFIGQAGTQVWLDIDRTPNSLDAILELVDANGNILALSNSSLAEEADPSLLFVSDRLDPDSVRPMAEVSERTETQVFTISNDLDDVVGGFVELGLFGQEETVSIPSNIFLSNPAVALQNAINQTFGEQLGRVEVSLARRQTPQFDPANPAVILRAGDAYVLEVRFDNRRFLGSDVPNLLMDTSELATPAGGTVTVEFQEVIDTFALQDQFSTNPRDPGMRLILPGEVGTQNLYHVRVRSSNAATPADAANLLDPARVRDGLTRGPYELQIRLREQDEVPGTQIRFSDIRYARTGLQIIGQPFRSPLLGEEYESAGENNTFEEAQRLGPFGVEANAESERLSGPLNSDQLSKSIAGQLDDIDDLDWYRFDVQYERLTRDGAPLFFSAIFDLDYADNFARADMAFYVFDESGTLIMTAGDSNIADDQPRFGMGVDSTDLGRGSAGTGDPFLGTVELSEGTYYVAIAHQSRVPAQLDQFSVVNPVNPLLRLEPVDSIQRIAEDRIGSSGGGTAAAPVVPLLFDPSTSILPYTLNDVMLYTIGSAGGGSQTVELNNPFTGQNYGSVGLASGDFADFAFMPNGELFAFNRALFSAGGPSDAGVQYQRISSETGAATAIGPTGIETYQVVFTEDGPSVVRSNTGVHPEAMAFRDNGLGFFVGNRIPAFGPDYTQNLVYMFNPQTGAAFSGGVGDRIVRTIVVGGEEIEIDERAQGAGTQIRERGHIETRIIDAAGNPLNPDTAPRNQFNVLRPTVVDALGNTTINITDGTTFTITSATGTPFTFEMDSGYDFVFRHDAEQGFHVVDGDQFVITTAAGPITYEFKTGPVLTVEPALVTNGAGVEITDQNGVTRRFEFDNNGVVTPGSTGVPLRDLTGTRISNDAVLENLIAAINRSDFAVQASVTISSGRVHLSHDSQTTLPVVNGLGLGVEGNYESTPGLESNRILINEDATRQELAAAIAAVVRDGVEVESVGNRIAFSGATSVDVNALQLRGVILQQIGTPGALNPGRILVPFSIADRDIDVALRIATAINDANLNGISATASGRAVSLTDALVTRQGLGEGFEIVGVSPGGTITGIAFVGSVMYAVSNAGGLYRVNNPTGHFQGNIGQYVGSATDLVGIPFTGLTVGPRNVDGGRYADLLFGTTSDGRVYAFNTDGVLQPVFSGGRTNIDIDDNGAVRGIAFSTLDRNLWHVTENRGDDPGHGINPLFNGTREGSAGGNSLYFGYSSEAFDQFTSPGFSPVAVPRQDGQPLENTYNFPGGAHGVIESNPFSLVGYSAADQPFLYFNYFLESDRSVDPEGQDAFRVYVIAEDGSEVLVATNATFRGPLVNDDEYDHPSPGAGNRQAVQQVFDGTNSWRQARVPLELFAGQSNLRLRMEFSTAGLIDSGTTAIRSVPGSQLSNGQTLTVAGQTFQLQFGTSLVMPPGSILAAFYQQADGDVPGSAPDTRITVDVGGVTFVLNDGNRNVDTDAGEVDVLLFNSAIIGARPLERLSAAEIAAQLAAAIEAHPPQPLVNLSFNTSVEPNNTLVLATPVPTSLGGVQIRGTGTIGDVRDIDLLRLDLAPGSQLTAQAEAIDGLGFNTRLRLFDAEGNELVGSATIPLTYTAVNSETVFLGISSFGNATYNPRVEGSGLDGTLGSYILDLEIAPELGLVTVDNRIELLSDLPVGLPGDSPLGLVVGQATQGTPVLINSGMTAEEVAEALREAMASVLSGGITTAFGAGGTLINFAGLAVNDPGPFPLAGNRYGDRFGDLGAGRAANNAFEGVYIDDIIIGFAERGEIATGGTLNTEFIVDPALGLTNPAREITGPTTGSYQLEIRDASEYVQSLTASPFRVFDTNDRLADGQTITALPAIGLIDGASFTLSDGNSAITFEFDLVEAGTGVQPGNVRIPYTLEFVVPGTATINPFTGLPIPGTGVVRPQTASEVAASIVQAINRSDVQLVLNVSALPASGIDTIADPRINLFGTSAVDNNGGGLASVVRSVGRGDANRRRDAQGVIMIESSRFLFNSEYGIDIHHGLTAEVAGEGTQSLVRYPRNLVELNTEALVPGVTVQSNVLAFNNFGGIRVSGIETQETGRDPVPFDRIINNTIIGGVVTPGVTAPADTFGNVLFPLGALSFADRVVSYNPDAGGGPAPDPEFQNTAALLGPPRATGMGVEPTDGSSTLSLGFGGVVVVEFVNNRLTGSGDSDPDLVIFESGAVESVLVEISRDGATYHPVGVAGGANNQIDIDAFGFGPQDQFRFVRLTDLRQGDPTSLTVGADIDAVGAISSVVVDRFVSGGEGIQIRHNAAPTLLNNVIANAIIGLNVDETSTSTVLGGMTFYRNAEALEGLATPGSFAQFVPETEELFVSAGELIFTPSDGAPIIDSSIDSLEDRASLVTVRSPLGLPPSPIIAPMFDVNGQLRVDDPTMQSPFGSGELVFKDRGAEERSDVTGPRAILTSPRAAELGQGSTSAQVFGELPRFFEIQLIDGLTPADTGSGVGIDDRSVSGDAVLVTKDGVPLVEGVDYRFGYNPSNNTIRITPLAGVFQQDAVYVIRLLDATDSVMRGLPANLTVDGSIFRVIDQLGNSTSFEYESFITVRVPQTLPGVIGADGATFTLTDGTNRLTFELDDNAFVNNFEAVPVPIPVGANVEEIAAAMVQVINQSSLQLSASLHAGGELTIVGNDPLTFFDPLETGMLARGAVGTSVGFGLGIPADIRAATGLEDGQTFVIRRGAAQQVVFEFDTNNVLQTPGAVPVRIAPGQTVDQIADELVRVISGAGLGLAPINAGGGRVALQSDVSYTVDLGNSVLRQLGVPGQPASLPVVLFPGSSETQSASTLAAAINDAQLPGVSASAVGSRVFLTGATAATGVGVVELPTIRDKAGNLLQSNQPTGRTELTVFVGSGFDYGDAPAPYQSLIADGGPRRRIDPTLRLGERVGPKNDALVPNADPDDDGVSFSAPFRRGFTTRVDVDVQADLGQPWALDILVDWNRDGRFDGPNESQRFGSPGNPAGLPGFFGSVTLDTPFDASVGASYVRVILTGMADDGSLLETGEIEDWPITITTNPYQNPNVNAAGFSMAEDVNDDGGVTPLDAVQVINALRRAGSPVIHLNPAPDILLPKYPDVDGDGRITANDALRVINRLNRESRPLPGAPQGESIVVGGAVYEAVPGIANQTKSQSDQEAVAQDPLLDATPTPPPKATSGSGSVFDMATEIGIDDVLDTLADDQASLEEDASVTDRLFASLK